MDRVEYAVIRVPKYPFPVTNKQMTNNRMETYRKLEDIKPKRDAGTCDFGYDWVWDCI